MWTVDGKKNFTRSHDDERQWETGVPLLSTAAVEDAAVNNFKWYWATDIPTKWCAGLSTLHRLSLMTSPRRTKLQLLTCECNVRRCVSLNHGLLRHTQQIDLLKAWHKQIASPAVKQDYVSIEVSFLTPSSILPTRIPFSRYCFNTPHCLRAVVLFSLISASWTHWSVHTAHLFPLSICLSLFHSLFFESLCPAFFRSRSTSGTREAELDTEHLFTVYLKGLCPPERTGLIFCLWMMMMMVMFQGFKCVFFPKCLLCCCLDKVVCLFVYDRIKDEQLPYIVDFGYWISLDLVWLFLYLLWTDDLDLEVNCLHRLDKTEKLSDLLIFDVEFPKF